MRPEGRHDAEPDVLVLSTLGVARASSKLKRGRIQAVDPGPEATPLPLTRATLIRPRPFQDEALANAWLEEVCADRELWVRLAHEAAAELNRLLHAHRTAAGDPYIADVDAGRAVAVRFGFGTGEDVADGRWRRANELPDLERRRLIRRDHEALRPQERIAAVLGGRESVGAHEELIIRARGDLDAGRFATAALGLSAGLDAMTSTGDAGGEIAGAARLAEGARRAVLAGSKPDPAAIETALRTAESALRRRALD